MIKLFKLLTVFSVIGLIYGFAQSNGEILAISIIVLVVSNIMRWLMNDHVR